MRSVTVWKKWGLYSSEVYSKELIFWRKPTMYIVCYVPSSKCSKNDNQGRNEDIKTEIICGDKEGYRKYINRSITLKVNKNKTVNYTQCILCGMV